MTKAELANAVSKDCGLTQVEALAALESTMKVIKETLLKKENIYLRGFGTFDLKHRAEKTARNISKNTTIIVPAHDLPHFKPCKEFADAMAQA
ncbi:MAG: integration host factor subunit beta [Bacteroidales bacterium]|nr:integration host factor subunit beta [Candidatus Physcousia equi]